MQDRDTKTLDDAALARVLGGQGVAASQRTNKLGGGGGGGPARGLGKVLEPIIEEAATGSPEFREPAHAPYRTP